MNLFNFTTTTFASVCDFQVSIQRRSCCWFCPEWSPIEIDLSPCWNCAALYPIAILLDPVYSGKGFAGLIGLIRLKKFTKEDNILFIHTGGAVSLSAYEWAFKK